MFCWKKQADTASRSFFSQQNRRGALDQRLGLTNCGVNWFSLALIPISEQQIKHLPIWSWNVGEFGLLSPQSIAFLGSTRHVDHGKHDADDYHSSTNPVGSWVVGNAVPHTKQCHLLSMKVEIQMANWLSSTAKLTKYVMRGREEYTVQHLQERYQINNCNSPAHRPSPPYLSPCCYAARCDNCSLLLLLLLCRLLIVDAVKD